MYSPKIKPDLVCKIYKLRQSMREKKPMTYYVNEAVERYLREEDKELKQRGDKNEK